MSTAKAFLKPVLGRSNLKLETGVLVEKVIFEGRRAVGVRYRQNGRVVEAQEQGRVAGVGDRPAELLVDRLHQSILDEDLVGVIEHRATFDSDRQDEHPKNRLEDHLQRPFDEVVHNSATSPRVCG